MSIRIFCDAADLESMQKAHSKVQGFTTNPALMAKSGIKSYRNFATMVLGIAKGKPVSFEVLADDFAEMEEQARTLMSWGDNIYVKIPITNTLGEPAYELIDRLRAMPLNITAVMTSAQIEALADVTERQHIVSIFAGRIADTGRDPMYCMKRARQVLKAQILWASAREVLNVSQADECLCDIITLTPELIAKLPLHGKNLAEYSLETVRMFHRDGKGITF